MTRKRFDPSNDPDTCLWCGVRLRHRFHTVTEWTGKKIPPPVCGDYIRNGKRCKSTKFHLVADHDTLYPFECAECGAQAAGSPQRRIVSRTQLTERPGAYADGYFCTGNCARYFAQDAAENGYRFEPRPERKAERLRRTLEDGGVKPEGDR